MQHPLFGLSWQGYLRLLFLLLATGFIASGMITWVASNWEGLSKFEKFYLIQGGLTVSVLGTMIALYRHWSWVRDGGFFLSAVLVGVLFALIGQTYQTGADTWELFAIWSLVQLPLLLIFPNVASALLLMTTANITFFLQSNTFFFHHYPIHDTSVCLNLLFVLLSERFSLFLRDTAWRILPKVAHLLFLGSLFSVSVMRGTSIAFVLVSLIGFLFYRRHKEDLYGLILYFSSLIIAINALLVELTSLDLGLLLLMSLFTLVAFVWGISYLKTVYADKYPQLETAWFIQVAMVFFALVCSGLLLVSLIFTLQSEKGILVTSIMILAVAVFLKTQKNIVNLLLVEMLTAIALVFVCVDIMLDNSEYYWVWVLGYTIVAFVLSHRLWLRVLSLGLAIFALGYQYMDIWHHYYVDLKHALMFCAVSCFWMMSRQSNRQWQALLASFAWSSLLWIAFIIGSEIWQDNHWQVASELPKITSFTSLFKLLTLGIFDGEWYWRKGQFLLISMLPLFVFFFIQREQKLKSLLAIWLGMVFVAMALGFLSTLETLFALAILLLAYVNQSRILFTLGAIMVITTLASYYYNLLLPLLYKSFLLLVFGGLFVVTTLLLKGKSRVINPKKKTLSWAKPLYLLTALSLILVGVNYQIYRYEDVLTTGKVIILEFAPADPRSLMQGDYMNLDYDIHQSIREQYNRDEPHAFYALLEQDERGVAQFCRVSLVVPTDFMGCVEDVYLPLKIVDYGRVKFPTESYFFAEGKGEYYAQARYGEYRFKQGKVLLLRLLDQEMKPL